MIIYKITNLINNKIYIGQTIRTLKERWLEHTSKSRNKSSMYISRTINKYGKENFIVEEIDKAETLEELNEKEIKWIKFYNSNNKEFGYNLADGGLNNMRLCHTEEVRKKISNANKGKPMLESTKIKISLANKGKTISLETRLKRSIARRGKKPHINSINGSVKFRQNKKPVTKSGYKGVSIRDYNNNKHSKKKKISNKIYEVAINVNNKYIYIGVYSNLIFAAMKYDQAVIKYRNGEGYLNFPQFKDFFRKGIEEGRIII